MGWGAGAIVCAIFWLGLDPGWWRNALCVCAAVFAALSVAREGR